MVVQLYVFLCVFVSSLFFYFLLGRAYDLLLCLGAAERGRPETAEAGRWWGALAASATSFASFLFCCAFFRVDLSAPYMIRHARSLAAVLRAAAVAP